MRRQLQIKDGQVMSEWMGTGPMPIPPDATWTFVDVTNRPEGQMQCTYDKATDTFSPPPPPPRVVSVREFMQSLLTLQERKAIRVAARTDDDVADWLANMSIPEPIRLQHPTTVAGLDMLVAKGLLTAARKAAILA